MDKALAHEGLTELEYVRPAGVPATPETPRSVRSPSRRFVVFAGGALVAILVPIFVSLGLWQWKKAEVKQALQTLLDNRSREPAIALPSTPVDAEALRYRRVTVRGSYEPQYQILIDNRIHQEQAGYHVITPLRIEGSEMRVLVNRGWISANGTRQLPQVDTPSGPQELQANATVPGTRFFMLAPETTSTGWQTVWQNLDLARYRTSVPFPLQPVVLQLDAHSTGGGFIREWPRPDERIERHIGYAWQWFGFAAASVGIWLFFLLRPWFSRQ